MEKQSVLERRRQARFRVGEPHELAAQLAAGASGRAADLGETTNDPTAISLLTTP